MDATHFSVYATPKPGTDLQQMEQALDAVLAEITEQGISDEELARSKSRMIADTIYANDNQRVMAQWYGAALATGSTVEKVTTWPDRIRAVSAGDVRDAARRWLDKRALGDGLSRERCAFRGETLVSAVARSRTLRNCLAAACLGASVLPGLPASAMTIERVVSPGGIEAGSCTVPLP